MIVFSILIPITLNYDVVIIQQLRNDVRSKVFIDLEGNEVVEYHVNVLWVVIVV
jgi:hypothetical protein